MKGHLISYPTTLSASSCIQWMSLSLSSHRFLKQESRRWANLSRHSFGRRWRESIGDSHETRMTSPERFTPKWQSYILSLSLFLSHIFQAEGEKSEFTLRQINCLNAFFSVECILVRKEWRVEVTVDDNEIQRLDVVQVFYTRFPLLKWCQ